MSECIRCSATFEQSNEPFNKPGSYTVQCGLPEGHPGNHTVLVPSNMPWSALQMRISGQKIDPE